MRAVVDDLAFLAADAIVRPATARLDPTTPAVRRLEQVGGPAFATHLKVQQELAVGAAVVTGAGGDLPADFVIHAVIQSDHEPVTRQTVETAWRSALQRAHEWEFASITTPPLGTGAGNLSLEDAAQIMVDVFAGHAAGAPLPREVVIVVESPADGELCQAVLQRVDRERA